MPQGHVVNEVYQLEEISDTIAAIYVSLSSFVLYKCLGGRRRIVNFEMLIETLAETSFLVTVQLYSH